ncbi:helix-turn-helix transcriptional regulator [Sorangium sp. So ce854]|uniref:helix-turn-helix transcriptional regulator n=1 Tax=Sorangium sp. So ce854 TaxID=3133322 RepID=UPI003F614C40
MIECYLPGDRREVVDTLCGVSDPFISAVVQCVDDDPTVDVVSRLPPGVVLRLVDVVEEPVLQEIPFFKEAFAAHGFAGGTVLTVTSGSAGKINENVALYLFQASGRAERAPTWRDCRVLELIHADVKSALERMRLPIVPNEPILYHMMRSDLLGYVVLKRNLEVLEANARAHAIAERYAGKGRARALLGELVRLVVRAEDDRLVVAAPIVGPDASILRVRLYELARELVELPESVVLIELDAQPSCSGVRAPELEELTPRQRQVAALFAAGLSYKEIAVLLDIEVGTVAVHVRNIYRAMGVHSRVALMARFA